MKLAYSPSPPDNGLGQYVSSPGNRAYCYTELAVSSLAVAVIITSTHFAYLRRDGQAELACLQLCYKYFWQQLLHVITLCCIPVLVELVDNGSMLF